MRETLLIYLNARHQERPSWGVVGVDGIVRQYAYQDDSEGIATLADNKNVIVVVPSQDVLLTTLKLPKMNRTRLLQALPFALEDQLISDVETLHFAPSELTPDGEMAVAVVARDKMQSWLALLNQWNIRPDKLIPAIFATPYVEDKWHVMVDEVASLRVSALQGVACDNNNLNELLRMALSSAVKVPTQIIIHHYGAQSLENVSSLAVPIQEERASPELLMQHVAHSVINTPAINLLQGDYAIKKSKLTLASHRRGIVYYLALALGTLLFLYPFGSLLILSERSNAIKDQISIVYKRHFPQAKVVTAPKAKMEEKLRSLNATLNENRVLVLIGYLGKALSESENIKLKRLDYQGTQLTLELTAMTSDDLSVFTDFLVHQGLKVNQQHATLAGSRVNATLQVE